MKYLDYAFEYADVDWKKSDYYSNMSRCLIRLNKTDEGLAFYDKSLELAKSDYDKFLCNERVGKCYFDNKEYDKAKKYLNEAYKYNSSVTDVKRKKKFEEMYKIVNNN